MSPEELREKILENHWLQGSVVAYSKLAAKQQELNIPPLLTAKDDKEYLVIVVNMSCDVVFGNSTELPDIECQLCEVNPRAKNSNHKLVDPRHMVLEHQGKKLDIFMRGRILVDRTLFAEMVPDSQLDQKKLDSLIRWKVSQYNRLALPESLIHRIGHVLRGKSFLKWVKEHAHILEGIFIELSSLAELSQDQDYELGILVVVESNKLTDGINIVDLTISLDEILLMPLTLCKGIIVLNYDYDKQDLDNVISSNEFTYDMLKRFRRYPLDHFSLDPELNTAPISI